MTDDPFDDLDPETPQRPMSFAESEPALVRGLTLLIAALGILGASWAAGLDGEQVATLAAAAAFVISVLTAWIRSAVVALEKYRRNADGVSRP